VISRGVDMQEVFQVLLMVLLVVSLLGVLGKFEHKRNVKEYSLMIYAITMFSLIITLFMK